MSRWCCVLRIGGIGDNLMAASVLPLLRERYDAIEVVSKAPCHVVFENNPYVDKLVVWPEDQPPEDAVSWQRKCAAKAAEFEPGAFFNLSHTCETSLAFLEGQTAFWWPAAARRKLCAESYIARVHDVCGVRHSFAPHFYPTNQERDHAWDTRDKVLSRRRGPIIGWCLSGSRLDKLYPYSHMAITRLITELDASVIVFGAPAPRDADVAKAIEREVITSLGGPAGLHTAITVASRTDAQWPIRRILTQLRMCDLVIGPDTGPMWSVAMLDMPKIVLLSHASALNIVNGWQNTVALAADPKRVPCYPCHRLHDVWDTCTKAKDVDSSACMADIAPQKIIDAARVALAA